MNIHSEQGFITLDFLLAFILVMGFTAILFAFTLTLSVVEVTQYITFSTARNYSVAHIDEESRENLALTKYAKLTNDKRIKTLFAGEWFEISKEPQLGNFSNEFGASPVYAGLYRGARSDFSAKVLAINLPIFGSTTNDETEDGFNTKISSYLGKDPTHQECTNFISNRWKWIKSINSRFNNPAVGNNHTMFIDNGC